MITRAHLIGELSPGHAAPRWPMARGRPGRRAGEPGHDHAAHVPDVGEHPARGRARDTGGSRGPPDRRAGAGTAGIRRRARARVWTSASTIASWARAPGHELSTRRQAGAGPLDAGEHEPEPTLADAGKHEPGPGRRRARAGAGTGHTPHPVAELAHDHAAHCARRRRPPT
jgi:hypothetical protein